MKSQQLFLFDRGKDWIKGLGHYCIGKVDRDKTSHTCAKDNRHDGDWTGLRREYRGYDSIVHRYFDSGARAVGCRKRQERVSRDGKYETRIKVELDVSKMELKWKLM